MSERKRVLPPVYFFLALLLMAAAHFWLPVVTLIDSPLTYFGAAPIVAGIGLPLWGSRLFGRADTTIKPFERSSALVTQGPFGYSRNPMYSGLVLALLGTAWLFGTLTPFAVVPAFAMLIQSRFIRAEEAMLKEAFGVQYDDYCKRVRRWL